MSCAKYKSAVEAAKEAVIHGLNTNEETNTLAELWRHYLGLRHIADNHKHTAEADSINFSFSSADSAYQNHAAQCGFENHAAEAVDYGYGVFGGQDVISFGDNVVAGAAGSDTISLG
nr:hypothetical protein [uncultured Mediterranean phage uvMED]